MTDWKKLAGICIERFPIVLQTLHKFEKEEEMNIDIINIGHYRVTSHGGRKFDLFNRTTDIVRSITPDQFKRISEDRSVEMCEFVELSYTNYTW